jgi:proteic killer suppression protein
MSDVFNVYWQKRVAKQLDNLPDQIVRKFYAWVSTVQLAGLRDTRKSAGFHDEPLKGERKGQRSVRLNKAYRAIYIETQSGEIELVEVIEVNKHDY